MSLMSERIRQIIHVDMDAFYASVEQRDHPELRGRPVIVGGSPAGRGVVSAASYEARRFGVHSAMPMASAIRKCPEAVVLPVRMARYVEISAQIHAIFETFTPLVEPLSLDEAFLDVTGSIDLFGLASRIGQSLKERIRLETGLTASVGIAPNKFLAKLASDLKKPDGFVEFPADRVLQVTGPLPVSRIWGVGQATLRRLHRLGIYTFRDLSATPLSLLKETFGQHGLDLAELAQGRDDRPVESLARQKSLSSERTFSQDISDVETLSGLLHEQVQEVAFRLRQKALLAGGVTLKCRYGSFRTITRNRMLESPVNTTSRLWKEAKELFAQWSASEPGALRLIGFGATHLHDRHSGRQLALFPNQREDKDLRLDQALDRINLRFGRGAVRWNSETGKFPDR